MLVSPRNIAIVYDERMKLPVVLMPDENGFIVAECPVILGCISEGRSREEALANIREAIELCLETRADEDDPRELPTSYEVVDLQVAWNSLRRRRRARVHGRVVMARLPQVSGQECIAALKRLAIARSDRRAAMFGSFAPDAHP
jgi:predicted RNase H-like HicB family nuclease